MHKNNQPSDVVVGFAIFSFTFFIFLFSPVHQVLDSHYSLLLSESLYKHGSFQLDSYFVLPLDPRRYPGSSSGDYPYSIEKVNGHLYYYFPPGSSVLSIPFVTIMNYLGISTIGENNTYDAWGELVMEAAIAGLLMSILTGLFYLTARTYLTRSWSAAIALSAALGTQIWSTASRGLWSTTWQTFLLGAAALLLVRQQLRPTKLGRVLLASVLSWSFFVRPTAAIPLAVISAYLIFFQRRFLPYYVAAGLISFGLFFSYSWVHFNTFVPNYYLANRLDFNFLYEAFLGNLLSPSRGLLVFVPSVLTILFFAFRAWSYNPLKELTTLSLFIIFGHLVLISTFPHWWGGYCYGPRFTTELIPWFVLLAVFSVRGMLTRTAITNASSTWVIVSACLVILSIVIHGGGALSSKSMKWNIEPVKIDANPSRLWDWRDPQFLAFTKEY